MVGIIILNYNTSFDTLECIKSIKKTTKIKYHIYIIDGNSNDDSCEVLSQVVDELTSFVSLKVNNGYSYGNNEGIKCAIEDGCDYILISNPDVIYYENCIDNMLHNLQCDNSIGIIGPSCASLDEDESQLLRKLYNDFLYICSKKPISYLNKICKKMNTEYDYPKERKKIFKFEGMVRGCCFMIPTYLLKKINLFDDNVFLYCEEWILAKKLKNLGLKCACDFSAKALHKEATSTNLKGNAFKTYHLYLSSFYYMKCYNKSLKFFLLFYYISNIIVFSIRAAQNDDYKKLLRKFVISNSRLLLSDREPINVKNKIVCP